MIGDTDTHQSVVQRGRQPLQVQPDVESRRRRDVHVKVQVVETLQDMVSLLLEVLLEGDLRLMCQSKTFQRQAGELTFSCATWTGSNRGIAASCMLNQSINRRCGRVLYIYVRMISASIQERAFIEQ